MCLLLSEIFHYIKGMLCPRRDPFDPGEEERVRAMPGIVMATDFSRPEHPRAQRPPSVHSTSRSKAYSTRSNLSDIPRGDNKVRLPSKCPAGEDAVRRIEDRRIRQQRQDLMVPFETHHTFREPAPSETSSVHTVPIYGNPNYTPELAMKRARIGRPKVNKADIPHAPPPGHRRRTVWNPYTTFNEPCVGDWRDEPFRTARNLGYKPPELRERSYSFLDDFADMKVWLRGSAERERREQRDKRLAEAVKIPPPRDPGMLPPRPMPGAFPEYTPREPWYGDHHPELPNGVRWRAGGSIPTMRPQFGGFGTGATNHGGFRSLGRNTHI